MRIRVSILGLMGWILVIGASLAALRYPSSEMAGTYLLLTLGVLALAVLGGVSRQGEARASWLGFAVFGWGYMILASGSWWDRGVNRPDLATAGLVDRLFHMVHPTVVQRLRPSRPGSTWGEADPRNKRVMEILEKPIDLPFVNVTPLEDIIHYLEALTVSSTYPDGIPIYVDPNELMAAKQTMQSPIRFRSKDIRLGVALRLMLKQLGLGYRVSDGVVVVDSAVPDETGEAFRRSGHCLMALLAGCLGAILARVVCGRVALAGDG